MTTRSINDRLGANGYGSIGIAYTSPNGVPQGLVAPNGQLISVATMIDQKYSGWQRNSAGTTADNTTIVTLTSVTIPAGTMGLNSVIHIISDWSYTNSASTKVFSMNWNGVNISAPTSTTSSGMKCLVEIANKNSLSVQTIQNNNNYGAASRTTDQTADTSGDVIIDFTCRWGAAATSETIILIGYSIFHQYAN